MGQHGIVQAPRVADCYVALDQLREYVDRVEWAPLRLSGERRTRPASPRLLHALVLHLAYAARGASDPGAPLDAVAVPLDVDGLASFLGTDADGVAGALGALQHAGVVHGAGPVGADRLPRAVSLTTALLGPAPRCAALDWGRVALATAGSPSAWVAAHVLAERLVLHEWTPMPRSALERTLGCGVSGVRSALERLTTAGVVERREQRGGVSAYRFVAAASEPETGRQGGDGRPRMHPHMHPRMHETPAAAPDTGVRLTVGGVELDVPPGLRVRVELGPDGRPQISLVPVAAAG